MMNWRKKKETRTGGKYIWGIYIDPPYYYVYFFHIPVLTFK